MNGEFVFLYFLNPSDHFYIKIDDYLIGQGFRLDSKENNIATYVRDEASVILNFEEDGIGKYIYVEVLNVSYKTVQKILMICPECGSKKLKPSVYHCWGNDLTERLWHEGKMDCGCAWDRFETRPPTKKCTECGCMWHNMADNKYWCEIFKSGKEITEKDLWIE